MKRMLAIAGTNNKNSKLYRLLHMWLACVSKLDSSVQYEILLLRNYNIAMCEGCRSCFNLGVCPLDQTDDMPVLRRKMLESEVLIFSSPVYSQNVTGIMKNFIDRIAVEANHYTGAKKTGFTLTTTTSSGGKFVSDLLQQVQGEFNIRNINNFIFRSACDDEYISCEAWARETIEGLKYQKQLN